MISLALFIYKILTKASVFVKAYFKLVIALSYFKP
jgi:hypothetical protein